MTSSTYDVNQPPKGSEEGHVVRKEERWQQKRPPSRPTVTYVLTDFGLEPDTPGWRLSFVAHGMQSRISGLGSSIHQDQEQPAESPRPVAGGSLTDTHVATQVSHMSRLITRRR
jgi:hypothetical protein